MIMPTAILDIGPTAVNLSPDRPVDLVHIKFSMVLLLCMYSGPAAVLGMDDFLA